MFVCVCRLCSKPGPIFIRNALSIGPAYRDASLKGLYFVAIGIGIPKKEKNRIIISYKKVGVKGSPRKKGW